MNLGETRLDEAVTGVREELAALRGALEAINDHRGELRRRLATSESETSVRLDQYEQRTQELNSRLQEFVLKTHEVSARLEGLEHRMSQVEAQTAETMQFVVRLRNLWPLRARRRLLEKLR